MSGTTTQLTQEVQDELESSDPYETAGKPQMLFIGEHTTKGVKHYCALPDVENPYSNTQEMIVDIQDTRAISLFLLDADTDVECDDLESFVDHLKSEKKLSANDVQKEDVQARIDVLEKFL